MASQVGGSSGGAGSECEGEEQEDSSSSNSGDVFESAPVDLHAQQNEDDPLSAFRQQWHKELVLSPHRDLERVAKYDNVEVNSDEDKAKQLFLRGVELERNGKLYDAVHYYKRAVQIMPDIESRLYQSGDTHPSTPDELSQEEVATAQEETVGTDEEVIEDEDEDISDGELVMRFQRILARKGRLCEPQLPQKGAHMSWLPYELVLVVLRWVVSSELDAMSLENVAATCRGLYVAARDPDIWRSLCARTWGLNCGTPKSHGFNTWRDMYLARPRLRLNGCYISKTTYLRHGENSYQDQFYRPLYLIDYYRYLRFFPEGVVLMWTTSEEPATSVAYLKQRSVRNNLGILSGHYRLVGDMVIIVVKKPPSEKKPAQSSNTRFRARRKDNAFDQQGQSFQLELQLNSVRSHHNWQLAWRGYSASSRRDQWSSFELLPNKYPPFAFSRVRHYTAEADAPLA